MAKLELPIQTFVEDYLRRSFPNRDWSRGSAIHDLLVQPLATLLQPLRHEIDQLRVNGAIANYPYMSRQALDALAANWGYMRQQGSPSTGTVRLYFSQAADYELPYLEFEAADGAVFLLQAPLSISTRELLANRTEDGNGTVYFFDAGVRSAGVGNRYALPAGMISVVRNGPPTLLRVEQPAAFEITAPDQSNFDVVEAMWRDLGARNLVSPASIRNPLYSAFPGLRDILVAGAGHHEMVRDIADVMIGGRTVQIHLGGMVDVWLNTITLERKTVDFSYLPSSKILRLVSADQVQARETLYSFSAAFLSADGEYGPVDDVEIILDESSQVRVDQNGYEVTGDIVSTVQRGRYYLSGTDVMSGRDLVPLPSPSGVNHYFTDLFVDTPATADFKPGDVVRIGSSTYRRLRQRIGSVLELDAPIEHVSTLTSAVAAQPGDLTVVCTAAVPDLQNCQLTIPSTTAAGTYRILGRSGTSLHLGNLRGLVTLSYVSDNGAGEVTYSVTGELPAGLNTTCWVEIGTQNLNPAAGTWQRILQVIPSATGVQLVLDGGSNAHVNIPAAVVEGLVGGLPAATSLYAERMGVLGAPTPYIQDFINSPTLTFGALDTTLLAGTEVLELACVGLAALPGDLVFFDVVGLSDGDRRLSGSSGTRFSLAIREVIDSNTVRVVPSLPSDLPAQTRYWVQRNRVPVADLQADSVTLERISTNVWPLGVGDAVGQVLRVERSVHTTTATTTAPGSVSFTLTLVSPLVVEAQWVELSGDITGTFPVLSVAGSVVRLRGASALSGAVSVTATFKVADVHTVTASSAGDIRTLRFLPTRQVVDIAFNPVGYQTASVLDVGQTVVQVRAGTSYQGTLVAFDNATRTWTIEPNDPAFDIFTTTGEEVTVLGRTAKGVPLTVSAVVPYGYVEPQPSDVGLLVRQGSYTGILNSFTTGATPEWRVKPLSAADTFDSLTDLVYVDRDGDAVADPTEPQGTLSMSASAPVIGAGTAVLTLDRPAEFAAGSTVEVLPRMGLAGGFFRNGRFVVSVDAAVNPDPFGAVSAGDRLIVLGGENLDEFEITGTSGKELRLLSAPSTPEASRIPGAPGVTTLQISSPIAAGATTFGAPQVGLWGHAGRVLRLRVSGTTYNLMLAGPLTVDSVQLAEPLPVTLYPGQPAEYEILDSLITPYVIIGAGGSLPYRAFRPLSAVDPLLTSSSGLHYGTGSQLTHFLDAQVDFYQLLGALDLSTVRLFVDSGPDASLEGYEILGVVASDTLETSHEFSGEAFALQYRIGILNSSPSGDAVVEGTIAGPYEVQVPIDITGAYQLKLSPALSEGAAGWTTELPPFVGVATGGTLTLSPNHSSVVVAGVFGAGFDPEMIGQPVLVQVRAFARHLARATAGTVRSTYSYYAGGFMQLPVAQIESVVRLNPDSLQPEEELAYTLEVMTPATRYSAQEDLQLRIDEDDAALFQPVRVTYLTDPLIERVDQFLNDDQNRVAGFSTMAKRMETIAVSLTVPVKSTSTAEAIQNSLSSMIAQLPSTTPLDKDVIIKHLYEKNLVTSVRINGMVLTGTYYRKEGTIEQFADGVPVFGSDVACYVPSVVTVRIED